MSERKCREQVPGADGVGVLARYLPTAQDRARSAPFWDPVAIFPVRSLPPLSTACRPLYTFSANY